MTRYITIEQECYCIRLERYCLMRLTYEVTPFRDSLDKWFLIHEEVIE
jgi:hypothetical protein